ncbi:MAG: tetratricopeptide repeat protein [Pseudomonadota bacterium]|nr:MAG: tetratricopeptide repeat protein [Pseudomonadota bacterium]
MDKKLYRALVVTAVALTVLWIGWSLYDAYLRESLPGEQAWHAANKYFEDGNYEQALREYETALRSNPEFLPALRGRARSLMQLGRSTEALATFDEAIGRAPEFGPTYANRGILHDRLGHYEAAIADYDRALALDSELAEGPHWLTRFLRLQPDKPPSIADRAAYLRDQLAKPESERLLRVPEVDEQQRPYKK